MVEEGTTISPQPHKMVFHKVSPTICMLLSVLLLFLSQETLSRDLIQVAPYEDKTVHLDGSASGSHSNQSPGLGHHSLPPASTSSSPTK